MHVRCCAKIGGLGEDGMNETLVRLAITQSRLFGDWPDETISVLIRGADVQEAQAGECVLRSGEPARHVYLVVSGSMHLSLAMPSGRSFTGGVHLAGDFHGLAPAMAQHPNIYTAICKDRTVLVRIPAELLRQLVAANGRLAFSLFSAMEGRFLQALDLHASAAVNSMQARVAALLKSVDARSLRGPASSEVHLMQHEIATMLGTTRQVVNRTLRVIADANAIRLQYGRILIVDHEKLDQMAREGS